MPVSHPPPHRFVVEQKKVDFHILNLDHPDGRSKAAFFIGWGFDPGSPEHFIAALLERPRSAILAAASGSTWGHTFVHEGMLVAPNGMTPPVRSVWEVRTGEDVARLVTAYPV